MSNTGNSQGRFKATASKMVSAESPISSSLRMHLIKGALGSFVVQVGFAGIAFLNAIVLARVLGAKGYGAFANAMAWVSLLTIPATFGFGILLVRDVAIYRSQGKWALLKGLLCFSNRFVLGLSVLLSLIAAAVSEVLFSDPEQTILRLTILVALPLVPLFALYNLRESSTRGLEYVIRACLPGMIIRPGLLLAGISAIYFFWPQHLSAPVAMLVNVGAGTLALGMGIFWLRRLLPANAKVVKAEYEVWSWVKAAFPMLVYGGALIVLGQTDIVMLGVMRGAEDVGLYAAANRVAFLLVYGMMASNVILAPVMSRLYANGEKERLQKIMTKGVRIAFFAVLPFGLIMIFAGNYFLSIFGHDFMTARVALIILAIGRLIDVALGENALFLSMTGQERIVAIIFTAMSLVNIVLNWFLIPRYGIEGAAYASIGSLITSKLFLSLYAAKNIGLNTTVFKASPFVKSL